MTYLITGATGNIGVRVVERILAHGVRPRVLVRDAEKARRRFGDRVDIVVADLADETSLASVFAGVDSLFLINCGVDLATRDAVAAKVAKAAGIKHIVKLSSTDARSDIGTGPWHARGESAIRASGIPLTVLRCAGFMSNALGWATSIQRDAIVRTATGDGKIPFIHPDDIAEVAVEVLRTRSHLDETLELTGPEALSYAQMTERLGAAVGKSLTLQAISDEEAHDGAVARGEPAPMVAALVSIWRAIREGRSAGVTSDVERTLGRGPLRFEQWAQENAADFRPRVPHVGSLPGYLNDSAGEGCPALIVIHEWWGVNAQIRGVVDRFAQAGYVAFAPDLYRGEVAHTAEEAQQLVMAGDKAQWLADLQRVVAALYPRKIGVVGFCMGGAFALTTAAHSPEVRACVAFYGIPRPESADLTKIRAAVLGHYARIDQHYSPERVDEFEVELRRASVATTFYRYDAQHAFFNEQRKDVYAPEHAQLAWDRTLAFLKEALG